jgi:hypothetical protein
MYGGKWYQEGCRIWGAPAADQIAEQQHQATCRQQARSEDTSDEETEPVIVRPKIIRKPVAIATIATTSTTPITSPLTAVVEPKPKTKRSQPKKNTKTASVAIPAIENIHATHIEQEMDEVYIDDYEVEHVSLSPFEHNDVMYYREPKKNKLFEQVKGGIGAYIGRYDSYTDTIRNDIPDSDDE